MQRTNLLGRRVLFRFACVALAAASLPAAADRLRVECPPVEAIPEFVTHRIELLSTLPAAGPGDAVALAQDPTCLPDLADPLARAVGAALPRGGLAP